jgi:uncharacterized protein YbjQ (UPF0145 family)
VKYLASVIKSLIEKRWAIVAIILGVSVGFGSAIICIAWNLVIFGFNIMYIVSPLAAGFVETLIARKKYGKSTGAISALLTFLLINGYGWFGSGLIFPKEPVTLSLITVIAIILTIQAAFPILMNYILFVVGLGIVRKIIGALVYLPKRIRGITPKDDKEIKGPAADDVFLDGLATPLVSVPQMGKGRIKKSIGLVTGEAVAEENEPEGMLLKLTNIIEPTRLEDIHLAEAKKMALSRMLEKAKTLGANTVVDVSINFHSMGGIQGSVLIVTATGTAVVYE